MACPSVVATEAGFWIHTEETADKVWEKVEVVCKSGVRKDSEVLGPSNWRDAVATD